VSWNLSVGGFGDSGGGGGGGAGGRETPCELYAVPPQMPFYAEGLRENVTLCGLNRKESLQGLTSGASQWARLTSAWAPQQIHFGAALNDHPYPLPRVLNEADGAVFLEVQLHAGLLVTCAQDQGDAGGAFRAA